MRRGRPLHRDSNQARSRAAKRGNMDSGVTQDLCADDVLEAIDDLNAAPAKNAVVAPFESRAFELQWSAVRKMLENRYGPVIVAADGDDAEPAVVEAAPVVNLPPSPYTVFTPPAPLVASPAPPAYAALPTPEM